MLVWAGDLLMGIADGEDGLFGGGLNCKEKLKSGNGVCN